MKKARDLLAQMPVRNIKRLIFLLLAAALLAPLLVIPREREISLSGELLMWQNHDPTLERRLPFTLEGAYRRKLPNQCTFLGRLTISGVTDGWPTQLVCVDFSSQLPGHATITNPDREGPFYLPREGKDPSLSYLPLEGWELVWDVEEERLSFLCNPGVFSDPNYAPGRRLRGEYKYPLTLEDGSEYLLSWTPEDSVNLTYPAESRAQGLEVVRELYPDPFAGWGADMAQAMNPQSPYWE